MKQIIRVFDGVDSWLENRFSHSPPNLGKIYALFSSFFLYLGPFFVKLSLQTNMMCIILVRSSILVYASFSFLRGHPGASTIPDRPTVFTLVLRGILSTIITFLYYGSLVYLPIQIVAVLYQTQTFFTFFLEMIFLGEKYTHVRFLCLLGVVVGLAFILNPKMLTVSSSATVDKGVDTTYVLSVLCVLASAMIKGGVNIILKSLKSTPAMMNSLFFGGTSIVISGGGFIATRTTFSMSILGLIFLLGSGWAALGYQTFNLKAIGKEDASVVSVFDGLTVLYSFAMDIFYFGVTPEPGAVMGSVLLLISLSVLSLTKKNQPQERPSIHPI
jgi:drug/metabolite transporter (DMT)-like permease